MCWEDIFKTFNPDKFCDEAIIKIFLLLKIFKYNIKCYLQLGVDASTTFFLKRFSKITMPLKFSLKLTSTLLNFNIYDATLVKVELNNSPF
jgi:hypothetical protein